MFQPWTSATKTSTSIQLIVRKGRLRYPLSYRIRNMWTKDNSLLAKVFTKTPLTSTSTLTSLTVITSLVKVRSSFQRYKGTCFSPWVLLQQRCWALRSYWRRTFWVRTMETLTTFNSLTSAMSRVMRSYRAFQRKIMVRYMAFTTWRRAKGSQGRAIWRASQCWIWAK